MVDLSKQLREAIQRSGLNRKQVADRAGVAYCAIHGFMSGKRGLTLDSASKILGALGLTIELRPVRRAGRGKTGDKP